MTKSKKGLFLSDCVVGFGGIIFLLSIFADPVLDDEATFFQQLIAEEGNKKIGIGAGIGMIEGGTIASIVLIGRIRRIKSVMREFPFIGIIEYLPGINIRK